MQETINRNHPATIYISAASDLMAEREALGRMIAGLPVTLAWRIGQTPLNAEPFDVEAVRQADLYLLLLGGDIRAPVGLEWHAAYQAGRPMYAWLKQGLTRTLAGQAFIRDTGATWQGFSNAADLSRQIERRLIEYLLHHAIRYALTPLEVEQLSAHLKAETGSGQLTGGEGAGHSAVILSRERFMPSEGIIVEP